MNTPLYTEIEFAHFVLHRPYHEYLASTTWEQRMLYYEHYGLHNLKQGYWNTMPDKRASFGEPEIPEGQRRLMLDAMIEESLEKQREKNAQQEQSPASNGRVSGHRVKV